MASHILVLLGVASLLYFTNKLYVFFKQYRAVRASGIPYVVVPFLNFETIPRILAPLWRPIVDRLPPDMRGKWAMHTNSAVNWTYLHNLYKTMGSDTYILLTLSGRALLTTADADVILQVTSRKQDFWKPLQMYKILDIFGKNVLSVEGEVWKRHRKVVGPPFTERNNGLVWNESLYSTQAMVDGLLKEDRRETRTIEDLMPLMGRLALSVISKAGYGVRLDWPSRDGKTVFSEDDTSSDPALSRAWIEGKTNGHTQSFGDAIYNVSHDIIPILLFPEWLLKILPFQGTKRAYAAYWNWGNYMREMIAAKRKNVGDLEPGKQSYDLLANLVKSAADSSRLLAHEKRDKPGQTAADKFTDEEILGNAFLLIVAGHETSAAALQHATLMLAMDLSPQRQLQKEIDEIFGSMPPSKWDYERDFPRLFGGMPGAILAEVLRLIPPVLGPPKMSKHETNLMVNGKNCRIPGDMTITLNIGAAQRNPRFWSTERHNPSKPLYAGEHASDPENDLCEFKPERWLLKNINGNGNGNGSEDGKKEFKMPEAKVSAEEQAMGVNLSADTAATLMKPRKGAYLPFMEGYRACMGRRFAQVEVMAIMAVLFQTYSVELAVDQWASDEEVAKMSVDEKKALWYKARAEAERHFSSSMATLITHSMRNGKVPVRFVRRGEERFPVDLW